MEVAVIADELTAVGLRLAGARILLATEENIESCFKTAQQEAELILLTAELAARLPQAALQAALHAFPPLTLVIADMRRRQEPPDLALEVRRALGVLP
jgi:vacuolar-type H+-ATPase subunit F/Vma7